MTEVSEQKRLGDRIVALTAERDEYIIKQEVWEAANDELRCAHIRMIARIRDLEEGLRHVREDCLRPHTEGFGRHAQITGRTQREIEELLRTCSTAQREAK